MQKNFTQKNPKHSGYLSDYYVSDKTIVPFKVLKEHTFLYLPFPHQRKSKQDCNTVCRNMSDAKCVYLTD